MTQGEYALVTINGGSSTVKFAVFAAKGSLRRRFFGAIERIGTSDTSFAVTYTSEQRIERHPIDAANHQQAAEHLAQWLHKELGDTAIVAIGHRVVHGGADLIDHQIVTAELLEQLRRAEPLDLAHLPREIAFIEVFQNRFVGVPEVVCLDTAFFRDLPRVSQLLPVPRKYLRTGVRRLGFHGLSYTYLMSQLQSLAPLQANGRLILAHLGSGASMAALRAGKPIDTSMGFTPTAGLVMGTRPGDIDPGLLIYLMQLERMSPQEADDFVNNHCGLVALSEGTSDMRDLLLRRATDPRAAEAVALFCYQAKKYIGAYAAALGGLDAVIFTGGIGEHSAEARAEICEGLGFLGIRLDLLRNAASAALISADGSAVAVHVIPTDEETVIATIAQRLVGNGVKQ